MAIPLMLYQLSVKCISDIGLSRQNNEDYIKILREEQFFVLADGMGGHQAGEIASKATVEQLCYLIQQDSQSLHNDIPDVIGFIQNSIKEVNQWIFRISKENSHLRGMGTTLCCLYLHPGGLIYAHVGDSRIYRLRNGNLEQLTKDHSLLRELIDLGQISEQQAEHFLYKNIITKAIGTEPTIEPDVEFTTLEDGDILVMCTDGLSDSVPFKEIEKTLTSLSEDEAATQLVSKAKENGGQDNITLAIVKIHRKNKP